jgi:long-subunit fatty acid transport protein
MFSLSAQTLSDAIRYSVLEPGSTARTFGVGGAFGSMGADFGVLTINPAGLAEYRSSEFMVSPSLYNTSTTTTLGTNSVAERVNSSINLDNVGVVFHNDPLSSRWSTVNISIGLNTIAELDQEFTFSGKTQGSITERFSQLANGNNPDQLDLFEAAPAYSSGAIFDFDEDFAYETDFLDTDLVQKDQIVESSGSIKELSLGLAGNLDERISLGVSFGIPFVRYEETKVYSESDPTDEIPIFEELQFIESLSTSGVGFNFKLGFIYKPFRNLRLGGAFHSPSYYYLTDDYYTEVSYSFDQGNGPEAFSNRSPDGNFKYKITSPYRFVGSIGGLFSAGAIKGFIDVDAEYLDYRNNDFDLTRNSSDPNDIEYERELNDNVQSQLTSAVNLRIGGELGYEMLRFRAGISLSESPYALDDDFNFSKAYSLGFGIREDGFFIDMAYKHNNVEDGYIPYEVIDDTRLQLVTRESNLNKFLLTFGLKF